MTAMGTFAEEVAVRLRRLDAAAAAGELDPAIELLTACLDGGGVIQAFGTGHSQAFAMEIAGRAGGLIPTNAVALRDVALFGKRDVSELQGPDLERDPGVVEELLAVTPTDPRDVFVIASNSGVNGSIVGLALAVQERGHRVIAVTSLEHTNAVEPKHTSGKRLSEIADVVIDNLAPYGDAAVTIGEGIGAGAVSSVTGAYIAQQLTLGVTERVASRGEVPPVYISANMPGGDEHNHRLEDQYSGRIRRTS